jgi:hypothetical protein
MWAVEGVSIVRVIRCECHTGDPPGPRTSEARGVDPVEMETIESGVLWQITLASLLVSRHPSPRPLHRLVGRLVVGNSIIRGRG